MKVRSSRYANQGVHDEAPTGKAKSACMMHELKNSKTSLTQLTDLVPQRKLNNVGEPIGTAVTVYDGEVVYTHHGDNMM